METVLLGFVDCSIPNNEVLSCTENKVGGRADWPPLFGENVNVLVCKLCGLKLALLTQIYVPLLDSSYHRALYVYICLNSTCRYKYESWLCVRCQWKNTSKSDESKKCVATFTWCDKEDNWSDEDEEPTINTNSDSLQLEKMTNNFSALLCNPKKEYTMHENKADETDVEFEVVNNVVVEELPSLDSNPFITDECGESIQIILKNPEFIPFYICCIEESRHNHDLTEHIRDLLKNYSKNNEHVPLGQFSGVASDARISSQDEKYEKTIPAHGSKLFHSFISRIQENPGQIIRYCRSNDGPLFLHEEAEIPRICPHCKGKMIFEMQILPTIIGNLKLKNFDVHVSELIDFGSAFIYTCESSCWSENDTYREECVLVQYEK